MWHQKIIGNVHTSTGISFCENSLPNFTPIIFWKENIISISHYISRWQLSAHTISCKWR